MAKQKQSCCSGDAKQEKPSCGCSTEKVQEASCGCGTEKPEQKEECSCGGPSKEISDFQPICGSREMNMTAGKVTFVPVKLCVTDLFGSLLARLGFNRMNFAVKPGLYAVGTPDKNSPVLVSANYKMSFDVLRKELSGVNAWILVLDTKGVNVWCAAGKGTFGTAELVKMAFAAGLDKVVAHRELIVPQLGAPGIAAHLVRKHTKFKVVYGPVEASDIKNFLKNGNVADERMRTVYFGLKKRVEVTGIEFASMAKVILLIIAAVLFSTGFTPAGYSIKAALSNSSYFIWALLITTLSSTIVPSILLPWLPGRMFSVKGAIAGFICSAIFVFLAPDITMLSKTAVVLISTAVSSFIFMNYTGSTTFTSLTGVKKEISDSVIPQASAAAVGLALMITDMVMKGAIKWN
jgi:acetyl-CoA decarbonylase/synthase complex subunit gamma